MGSVRGRSTCLASVLVVVFVTETVGRPIAVGQDRGATMITSERRSAEAPETRRLLALKEEVDGWYGMISSYNTWFTGDQFSNNYASVNFCTVCDDSFADLTWTKLLTIFLITLGILVIAVVLFWTLCHCCMCRHDPNCICKNPELKVGSRQSIS